MSSQLEQALADLSRIVFENSETVTLSQVQATHPNWSTDLSKKVLFAFADRFKHRLDVRYVATGRDRSGNLKVTLLDDLSMIERSFASVESVAVFMVCKQGSIEPSMEILSRNARVVRDMMSAGSELWRPQYAALASDCPTRTVRASVPSSSNTTKSPAAFTPANTARKTDAFSSFKKPQPVVPSSPLKSAPHVKSPDTKIQKPGENSRGSRDEDEDVIFRKPKKQKIASSAVGEDQDMASPQVNSRKKQTQSDAISIKSDSAADVLLSSENSSVANLEQPVFETKEVEFKQKKKITVTEISLSSGGYMQVEDKDEMKEEVVKETVTRQVNKPATAFRPQGKASAPSGQRSITDMFRKG